jgi:hypothetical protein
MRKHCRYLTIQFLFIIFGFLASADSVSETRFIRACFSDRETAYDALELFEAEAMEIFYEEKYLVLQVTPEDIDELKALEFIIEPVDNYNIHHNRCSKRSPDKMYDGIPGYPSYLLVEETFHYADSLAKTFPELATWTDAGDSWEKTQGIGGYDHMVLVLTNTGIAGPKPKLFVTGSIHAREYTTAELNRRFVKYLIENYGTDADVTWLLDYHELHAMFYVNPDGRKHAEKGISWRKNTNTDYCVSNHRYRGVDLNRNFDYDWTGTGSGDECNETYYGPRPASEPETKVVKEYMQAIYKDTPGQGVFIDLHSFGKLIYIPASAVRTLAYKFTYFNDYEIRQPRGGGCVQWGYFGAGVPSFCFELGTAFFQGCDYFESEIPKKNFPAMMYAFKACRDPEEIPLGPDAIDVTVNGSILSATIDDTRYGGSTSTQNIAGAEYYVGIPPWENGAIPVAMAAKDGNFNEKKEEVEATIITGSALRDKTILFVRGRDTDGKWGAVSAVFHDITGNTHFTDGLFGSKVILDFPNPAVFPAILTITVLRPAEINLVMYDIKGNSVSTIVNSTMEPGKHAIQWNGRDDLNNRLAAGLYLFHLGVGNYSLKGKIVVVR